MKSILLFGDSIRDCYKEYIKDHLRHFYKVFRRETTQGTV